MHQPMNNASPELMLTTGTFRWQLKTLILSMNVSIAICRQPGDKWQIKNTVSSVLVRNHRLLKAFSIAPTQCDAVRGPL